MRRLDEEMMSAVLAADLVKSTVSGDLAGKEETCGVERSSSGGLAEEPFISTRGSTLGLFIGGERVGGERCDVLAHG